MDLTTLSSLRACRTLKTVVKRKFFTYRSDPYVTSCVSDAQNCGKTQIFYVAERPFRHFGRVGSQNCGKMRILAPARATLSSLRTCRTPKTEVKCKFWMWPSNPFVTSDVSDAQNCGKTQILRLTMATLSWLRACWTLKIVVKCKLLMSLSDPFVTSCGLGAQNCSKMQYFVVWSSTGLVLCSTGVVLE